jgi:PAT family beta-lactamase induction signal transducer AmpG
VPTLSESRLLRFITFGALYFAQGVPWGFISIGYVTYLTDQGLDNTGVGAALSLAYLPWSFKLFWGPIVDRFPSARFGRRRPFIVGSELLMGATLLVMVPLFATGDISLINKLVFLHNTFAALQDVAVDALAVDLLPERERSSANGVMWASKVGGVMLGGGGAMFVVKRAGWTPVLLGMVVTLWAIMALVLLVRERPADESAPASPQRAAGEGGSAVGDWLKGVVQKWRLKELYSSFAFPTAIAGVFIALLTPAGFALTGPIFTRMLRADLKMSEDAIGLLGSILSNAVGVGGALLGGVIADRFGKRKVIAVFMVGIAASQAAFAMFPHLWPSLRFLIAYTVASQIFITAYSSATLGFFMTLSNPAVGATHFAIYMAATNLTYSITARTGGWLADRYGLAATFAIAAAIQLVTVVILPFCDPRIAEERFRRSGSRPIPLPETGGAPGA